MRIAIKYFNDAESTIGNTETRVGRPTAAVQSLHGSQQMVRPFAYLVADRAKNIQVCKLPHGGDLCEMIDPMVDALALVPGASNQDTRTGIALRVDTGKARRPSQAIYGGSRERLEIANPELIGW